MKIYRSVEERQVGQALPKLLSNVTERQTWGNQERIEFLRVSVSCPTGSRWHFWLHPISQDPLGGTGMKYMVQRKLPKLVWGPGGTGAECWASCRCARRGRPCRRCSQLCPCQHLPSLPWEGKRRITFHFPVTSVTPPPTILFLFTGVEPCLGMFFYDEKSGNSPFTRRGYLRG